MRKSVLLGCLLLAAVAGSEVRAQWSVRPEVGMTAVYAAESSGRDQWNPSWRLGIGAEYRFPESRWAVSSGLFFTERTSSFRSMYFVETPSGDYSFSAMFGNGQSMVVIPPVEVNDGRQLWLQADEGRKMETSFYVPIMAKVFFPLKGETELSLALGPYVGYAFHNKVRSWNSITMPMGEASQEELNDAPLSEPRIRWDKHFDWGLCFQLGLEVRQWTLSAGYELSMQGRYPGVYHYGKPNDYFHTVSLSIGYKFNFGK